MTLNNRDLQLIKQQNDQQFEQSQEIRRGQIVNVNGSFVGSLPNTVWVQPLDENSSPRQVFNPGTILNLEAGVNVYYWQSPRPPAAWELIDFDLSIYAPAANQYQDLWQLNIAPHATLHELKAGYPGPDPLNVHPHAVVDLSVRPTNPPSMKVRIYGGWYAKTDGTYAHRSGPVNSTDLTASIPASVGLSSIVAFSLDRTDGTINTYTGADYVEGTTPVYPSVPTSEILLSAVRLTNGMTAIENQNFDREMRGIVGNAGAAFSPLEVFKLVSPDQLIDPVISADNNGDVTIADGDLIFGTSAEISSAGSITLAPAVGSPVIIADASGNTRGLRILGSTPATEIVDLFVGSTGTFFVDFTNSSASTPYMEIKPTDDEYGLKINAPSVASPFLNIFVVDAAVDYANLTVSAVGGTNGLFILSGGKIGINTSTVPHGGIGAAMLALDGANASAAGPHVQFTTVTDDYPVYQQLNWAHDNIQWLFDSYFNGTNWFSSDAGSNIRVLKGSDSFRFDYASGIAQGSAITWSNGITLNPLNGRIGIGVTAPAGKTHIDQASTTAAIPVLYLDQADLSEEFIEFAATVGAGNPIDTAAIGTYYGKIRVAVAGVGFKYMALYNS